MPTKLPAKLTVDFTGVEIGGGLRADRVPEGDYLLQVTGCQMLAKQSDSSRRYLLWTLKVVEPKSLAGKKLIYRTSLVREALWNLRTFLAAMLGEDKVPQRALELPLPKIVAMKPIIGATVQDDEYEGKVRSEISAVFPKADYQASGENEETTTEEETEEADDDVSEIDLDEDL
jgi:hypothetical protein